MRVVLHFLMVISAFGAAQLLMARDLHRRSAIGTPFRVIMGKLVFWACHPEWPLEKEPASFVRRLVTYRVLLVIWLYGASFALLYVSFLL